VMKTRMEVSLTGWVRIFGGWLSGDAQIVHPFGAGTTLARCIRRGKNCG
jgi:hypothetical protein